MGRNPRRRNMSFKYSAIAAALVVSSAALAQAPAPTGVQPGQPSSTEAGETSDRTPDKSTQTPQNQQDTASGKTSDRSQNKDVKVQHQPGAAGTSGSESSEGASSGTSGSNSVAPSDSTGGKTTAPSTTPPPASSGTAE
jgi:hypothetical protein